MSQLESTEPVLATFRSEFSFPLENYEDEQVLYLCFPANAHQMIFKLSPLQIHLYRDILDGLRIRERSVSKMSANSGVMPVPELEILSPDFKSRPLSAFYYLYTDDSGKHYVLVLMGKVVQSQGVIHDGLREHHIHRSIMKAVGENKAILVSGHIWANLVLLDPITTDEYRQAERLKIALALMSRGYLVLGGDGEFFASDYFPALIEYTNEAQPQ